MGTRVLWERLVGAAETDLRRCLACKPSSELRLNKQLAQPTFEELCMINFVWMTAETTMSGMQASTTSVICSAGARQQVQQAPVGSGNNGRQPAER